MNSKFITSFLIIFSATAFFYFSCDESKPLDEKTKAELMQKGSDITQQLAGALMTQLTNEIQQKGIVNAIQFCSVHALPITDSISKKEGVTLSRVSHRNRNPHNAANDDEQKIIQEYNAQLAAGEMLSARIISKNNKHTYYAPILISVPACLKCHGNPQSDIDAEVLQILQSLYPSDKATGFSLGELRGLFRVEFLQKN